ncbi:MAG: ExsB family transcriptional regulator [Planctomycetota bacterium]
MDYKKFVDEQVKEIKQTVGNGIAINALSGGVDSSVVTMLGHKAIGEQLKTYFVSNGLMRQGEPEKVVDTFKKTGVKVELIDAKKEFLGALKGLTDPEEKRQAITDTFYAKVFSDLVKKSNAKFLFHGTILTDIEETVAGIKRQHNILTQIGIDTEKSYGYKIIEPLKELRKDGVREVAKHLGMPEVIHQRIPFPGPALATRVIGEITEQKLETVRKATAIVEEELSNTGAFQYFAVLMNDRATGIRNNKREFGQIIIVRCINSTDARTADVTELPWQKLHRITERILQIPDVNRVCYDLTPKPPATVEYI